MSTLYMIGTGPGNGGLITPLAAEGITKADVICGYDRYLDEVEHLLRPDQTVVTTGMTAEVERVEAAIAHASAGKTVALISGGDPSLYGLASLAIELGEPKGVHVEVIPGITAALAASARLGCPVTEDLAIISLSDLLTPWERIIRRIHAANDGDFVTAIYNPRSTKRVTQLPYLLSAFRDKRGDLPVGAVKNAWRDGEEVRIATIDTFDVSWVDMSTIVIVGNSQTRIIEGRMVTPRGYRLEG